MDWVVLPRSKDGGLAVVFAGEVKGGTLPVLPVTPADVIPGRLAPVGPEPSAGGLSGLVPPVIKHAAGAGDQGGL